MDYHKPKVVDYGNLTKVTAGGKIGNFTDANFPVHLPKQLLTFSG
jgi:hypothetical protein